MSGETKSSISSWTLDTLKEYLEVVIDGNDRRYQQRFEAQEASNKYVQEKSNEFRGSLEDIGKKQMPRTEAESLIRSAMERSEIGARTNSEKIDALQARMDRNEGRGGGFNSSWGFLVGAVGLIATLIMIFMALRKG